MNLNWKGKVRRMDSIFFFRIALGVIFFIEEVLVGKYQLRIYAQVEAVVQPQVGQQAQVEADCFQGLCHHDGVPFQEKV